LNISYLFPNALVAENFLEFVERFLAYSLSYYLASLLAYFLFVLSGRLLGRILRRMNRSYFSDVSRGRMNCSYVLVTFLWFRVFASPPWRLSRVAKSTL